LLRVAGLAHALAPSGPPFPSLLAKPAPAGSVDSAASYSLSGAEAGDFGALPVPPQAGHDRNRILRPGWTARIRGSLPVRQQASQSLVWSVISISNDSRWDASPTIESAPNIPINAPPNHGLALDHDPVVLLPKLLPKSLSGMSKGAEIRSRSGRKAL
jgi:hypothetical protein